jgi:enterochelin esterase family protein
MPTKSSRVRTTPATNPVVEGSQVTFHWQSKKPVLLLDDLHNWDDSPQAMTAHSPGLWSYALKLPQGAYLEYAFLDPSTRQRVDDPLNAKRVTNGFGEWNNFFYMPGGYPTDLIQPAPRDKRGTLTRHKVETSQHAATSQRMVYLYQPAVTAPVPLLVVYDGEDYLRRGFLQNIVDNLILQERIRPLAMALVQNGGKARLLEYSCSDATLDLLTNQVLPLAQEHLNLLSPRREPYSILGASMGGLMALYTGLRLPQVFGKVLSQSGAFFAPDLTSVIADLVRHLPPPPHMKLWMDVGRLEFLLPGNRKMHRLLTDKGYPHAYREYPGGHNYTSWRNDLWRGLEAMYGQQPATPEKKK